MISNSLLGVIASSESNNDSLLDQFSRLYRTTDQLNVSSGSTEGFVSWQAEDGGSLRDPDFPTRLIIPAGVSVVQITTTLWPNPVNYSGQGRGFRINLRKNDSYSYDGRAINRWYGRDCSVVQDNWMTLTTPLLSVIAGDWFEVAHLAVRTGTGTPAVNILAGSYIMVEKIA